MASPPPLRVGQGSGHVKLQTNPDFQAGTFLATNVCLRRPTRVRLTDVRLANPVGEAEVTAYTVVRARAGLPGAVNKPLRKVKSIPKGSNRVKGECGRPDHAAWYLYVEIGKSTDSVVAGGTGVRITYRHAKRLKVATTKWGLYLCDEIGSDECNAASE